MFSQHGITSGLDPFVKFDRQLGVVAVLVGESGGAGRRVGNPSVCAMASGLFTGKPCYYSAASITSFAHYTNL
jgi:hypothetical protein